MEQIISIVVLPFVNLSPDGQNESLVDSMTGDLIINLSKINGLKVTSKQSSFYYKNRNIPLDEISKKLGVKVVLEGSIQILDGRIKVSASLVQASEDFLFWSDIWERKIDDFFRVQDELSEEIAQKLQEQIGHFEIRNNFLEHPERDLKLHKIYLEAKNKSNQWNPQGVLESIVLFEEILDSNPQYIEAHIGIADAYSFLAVTRFMNIKEAWAKVNLHGQMAKQIDPNHAGVYYILANVCFFDKMDFASSLRYAKKAVKLQSNHSEALQFLVFLYSISGACDLAYKYLEKVQDCDPFSSENLFYQAFLHYRNNEFDKALKGFNQCLNDNPHNIPAYFQKGFTLLALNKAQEMLDWINKMPSEIQVLGDIKGLKCLAYILLDEKGNTQKALQELKEDSQNHLAHQEHSYWFLTEVLQGYYDEAFDWLDQLIRIQSPIVLIYFGDTFGSRLSADIRYKEYHKLLFSAVEDLENEKVKKLLSESETENARLKLESYLQEEDPFLNPKMSLRHTAQYIGIHPNQLSWLINNYYAKNFNVFVNEYRIERFIKLAKDTRNQHISLLGLAFESGFNSKSSFNTFFKKIKGCTPKEFLMNNKNTF
ncbi:MAG: helix-turn-helix domain-containing protein [Flavobacteriales bacterium]|jgi:TolB-like protein/AraC-like DNA-binding protein/Tfp pilus assembly protein PilF|nr:helix-turn-helix domain-containing protein [Flavobacteriales bacterium]